MIKKLLLAAALTLTVTSLVGCGKTTQEKVDQGNRNIKKMNSISSELAKKGIYVQVTAAGEENAITLGKMVLGRMSAADMDTALALLNQYAKISKENLGIIRSDGVKGGDEDMTERGHRIATTLLGEIKRLKDGGTPEPLPTATPAQTGEHMT